jgi:hypothetical protein
MGVLPLDLRANPNDRDGLTPRPFFDFNTETSPDALTAHLLANHKAADDRARRVLQMPFHRGVDPAHHLTVDNRGKGDPVGSVRQLLNALAKIPGRTGIAELAAQPSGCLCIIDGEPADGNGYAVPLGRSSHIGIIARLLSDFQFEQDDRTLRDRNFHLGAANRNRQSGKLDFIRLIQRVMGGHVRMGEHRPAALDKAAAG